MAAVAGIRAAHATLTASTVDTVTMSGGGKKRAELVNQGSDVIYFRTDGTDPVAEADENEVILGSERLAITLPDDGVIKLISAGTPTYSVIVTG
jgi:hypothetical protein